MPEKWLDPYSPGTIRYTLKGKEHIEICIDETGGSKASLVLPIESVIKTLQTLRKRQLRQGKIQPYGFGKLPEYGEGQPMPVDNR